MVYSMRKKVVFVSEYMQPPFDEGIKKTVFHTYVSLCKHFDVITICRQGFISQNVHIVRSNRLFLSKTINKLINEFAPEIIIYFPFASTTFAGFVRHFILSNFYPTAKNLMIALQPKPIKFFPKQLVRFIKPEKILTPSPLLIFNLKKLNIKAKIFPLPTNLSEFSPISNNDIKKELRKKYNIPNDAYVIIHVGHLNDGRNLMSLSPLQKNKNQVVIVGSSSTPKESIGPKSFKKDLIKEGFIIIDKYIENIEELYQLSDLYIFPVIKVNSSIGLPLSVLEARACGIPVLTTDFGSIKYFLGNDYGNIFYCKPEDFSVNVENIKKIKLNADVSSVKLLSDKFENILVDSVN